jgi:4-azaleucine resistance transporter AzlC
VIEAWREPRTRSVIIASVTLGVAVGAFGFTFGVGAVSAGSTVAQACAMSLLIFTGATQFSAVTVIAAGGSAASAFGGALLLSARNGVYGLAMSRRLTGSLGRRLVAAQLTLDESTAMSAAQTEPDEQRIAFWITGASIYVFWNLGTLFGALAGTAINPLTYGLDVAFPAAYVAMLWPLLRDRRARLTAACGGLICLVLIPFAPIGVPVLAASLAILLGVPR